MSSLPRIGLGVLATVLLSLACSPAPARNAPLEVALPLPIPAPRTTEPVKLRVLMINGGGNPQINYQSHLQHIRHLDRLLTSAGVDRGSISILASDGPDPGLDLATREVQPEPEFWRLAGTRAERFLRTPLRTIDSKLDDVPLAPATKAELTEWFRGAASELDDGDTLLIYVTDHGTRHGPDPLNNRITLWGKDESIDVREFGALLATLHPGVRVVTLMSQCFSGAFAELASVRETEGEPSGNVCGYFAATADRPAYGCFPENLGKDSVGHSFEFMRALERTGRFSSAHESVLVHDDTPDVPLRTSDAYLASLVKKDAQTRGTTLEARADELLREAFARSADWEAETRLLDRIAQATGSFSPRSLAELQELAQRLPEIDEQLKLVDRAWTEALADANTSTLDRFAKTRPEWTTKLADASLARISQGEARTVTAALLEDLRTFTAADASMEARLRALRTRGEEADAASYRMQVRLAVVLRMRSILLSIAGRQYVRTSGSGAQKRALAALDTCEDLSLPGLASTSDGAGADETTVSTAYPPFEEDLKLTRAALPGYLGIRFRDPPPEVREKHRLPPGASIVQLVYPDSPALSAGLEPGDIVLGPPGEPFITKNQIRAWTMLSEIGQPAELEILRLGKRKRLSIVPDPFPMKWPALPGPVQVGSAAPKIELSAYRGPVKALTRANAKMLVYFWATWCGPCKAALPELLAYEKKHKVPIIAITDEGKDTLDAFFKKFTSPFPNAVAMDPLRRAFIAYGVSGTPTFVLLDEKGSVAFHQVGYTARGLALPGWEWSGKPKP